MNTSNIAAILSHCDGYPQFRGVYALDHFMRDVHEHRAGMFVVNTHESFLPGEHWLAVIRLDDNVHFFDSYGLNAPIPAIGKLLNFCSSLGHVHIVTQECIQGFGSTTCGDYCVLLLFLYSRGWNLQDIVSTFLSIPNSHRRDHAARHLLREMSSCFFAKLPDPIHIQEVKELCPF